MTDSAHSVEDNRQSNESERYQRACCLFLEILDVDPAMRVPWLSSRVRDDAGLRAEVEAMLRADSAFVDPSSAATQMWEKPTGTSEAASTVSSNSARFPQILNYQIIEEIACGGMGVVYKAEQLRPRRIVALKMMRMRHFASSAELARFLAEAEAAAQLDDAAVVPVYELGECEGEPFIAMKYIDGENLEQALRNHDWSINQTVETLLPVCWAVASAHEKGIIHRDLKPSNVLIDGVARRAWVTDFGLAKNLNKDSDVTHAGDVMGTPGYMAPEQALGALDAISPAADVYGLGAILYRALTGAPPVEVDAANPVQAIQQIRNNDVAPPRERNRRLPDALNSICLKCLATQPHERYAHAGDLAADLERFLDGESISARPLGWPRRLHRWARTHPGLAVSWGAIAAFFAYHLICRLLKVHVDPTFDRAAVIITGVAFFSAWCWQTMLTRTGGQSWVLYAWTTCDVALLTLLSLFAKRDNSELLVLFPVIVAASVLRCRPYLVGYVTAIAMLGYALRATGIRIFTTNVPLPWSNLTAMLLCLALIGAIQYLTLTRSAASLEAKLAMNSESRLRHFSPPT